MKLRNKKTGEVIIVEFLNDWQTDDGTEIGFRERNTNIVYSYKYLADLTEEWEDYEETKEYWYILGDVEQIQLTSDCGWVADKYKKQIGNYFETREEAEKAVEKLKVWKRLKDKGFKFDTWFYGVDGNRENGAIPLVIKAECKVNGSIKDLDLLFGGDES